MTKLIINNDIELEAYNFNQYLSKNGEDINMSLNISIILGSSSEDLTKKLKNCLEDDSIDTIKIVNDDKILYYTEVYNSINNVSFGSNLTDNNDRVEGYINFEAH